MRQLKREVSAIRPHAATSQRHQEVRTQDQSCTYMLKVWGNWTLRECLTRLNWEANSTNSPGKRNPSEHSTRSRSSGEKSTQNKKGVRKENHASGKRERCKGFNAPENAVTKRTYPFLLEHGTPTISAEIEGISRSLILDTGSNISIMQLGVSKSNVQVTTLEPYGVTVDVLDIRGQQLLSWWTEVSSRTPEYDRSPLR